MDLIGTKSVKQQEKSCEADELVDLLSRPSAKQASQTARFRTEGGSKLKEFCRNGTKADCARMHGGAPCASIHFRRIIKPHTDVSLGDCSYLDTCRHVASCKFIHYEVDADDAMRMRQGSAQLDPFAREATNSAGDNFSRHYAPQFICCDIRTFPMQVLRLAAASASSWAPSSYA
jgi:mRNA (2'-O-methyladenosine-N6-)-methyltransferase